MVGASPSRRGGVIIFRSLKEAPATLLDDIVEAIQWSESSYSPVFYKTILNESLSLLSIYGSNCEPLNVTLCFIWLPCDNPWWQLFLSLM